MELYNFTSKEVAKLISLRLLTVQLPVNLQERASELESPRDRFTTEAALSNLQILLVDDETDTCEFQAFLLEQSGARVTAVASGFEALQTLDQFTPDVIVSDVGMAEMDGYMLMQQIRSRPHGEGVMIPAIALTTYARDLDQQQVLQAGFQQHLAKPVEPEVLVRELLSYLNGSDFWWKISYFEIYPDETLRGIK